MTAEASPQPTVLDRAIETEPPHHVVSVYWSDQHAALGCGRDISLTFDWGQVHDWAA